MVNDDIFNEEVINFDNLNENGGFIKEEMLLMIVITLLKIKVIIMAMLLVMKMLAVVVVVVYVVVEMIKSGGTQNVLLMPQHI